MLLRIDWRRIVNTKKSRIAMEVRIGFQMIGQFKSSRPRVTRKQWCSSEDASESTFDKLVSYASMKHSLRFDDKPVGTNARRERATQMPWKLMH